MKGRPPKETQKNKTRKNKKPSGIAKGSKQQGNETKTKTNLTKGGKQYTLLGGSVGENEGGNLKHPARVPTNKEVTGEESGLDDQRNEVHRSDAAASGCGSGDVDMASSGVVPAKNLQRSEDGQVVLLWTR